jgi:hypothetical protein
MLCRTSKAVAIVDFPEPFFPIKSADEIPLGVNSKFSKHLKLLT